MEDILARLARGELTNPLRFVVSPAGPSGDGADALPRAPATSRSSRSRRSSSRPATRRSGLDPHQGAVLLHDGITGQLIAILNASPITEIRTAAVSGVATKLLARPGSRTVAVLGSGVQGRSHVDAMQTCSTIRSSASGAGTGDHAEALALETHSLVAGSVEEALDGADVVCTATSASEPLVELELARAGHAHQRRRGVPRRKSRELSTDTVAASRLFVDRRESTLNEAGDYRVAAPRAASGPSTSSASSASCSTAPSRAAARDDELTVFKSMGIAVEDLAAARSSASPGRASAASASRSTSDPARRHRGRPRAHRRRRRCARRSCGSSAGVAGRDLAEARVPAADRLVQDPRRRERDPARRRPEPSTAASDDERRQHGAGRRLDGPRARRARDGRRARPCTADRSSMRSSASAAR